jgi:hypothetical protein
MPAGGKRAICNPRPAVARRALRRDRPAAAGRGERHGCSLRFGHRGFLGRTVDQCHHSTIFDIQKAKK